MLSQRATISLATVLVAGALWFSFTSATGWIGAARRKARSPAET